jgi:hypothetical protein
LRRGSKITRTACGGALALVILGVPTSAGAQAAATISISDTTVGESSGPMVFNVTLNAAQQHTVTVEYSTADVTAVQSEDYTSTTGSVVFAAGETSKPVNVSVLSDSKDENDEYFALFASTVTGAGIDDGEGNGTIVDDDPQPSLAISDLTITEGNSGQTDGVLTVSLSSASGRVVGVDYATSNGSANSSDYATRTGHLAFNPGQTSKTVPVTVLGDTIDEPDETFVYTLSAATNASISDSQATVTIADDDGGGAPTLSIDDVLVVEGHSGPKTAALNVTLSSAAPSQVSVTFQTADGTATVNGGDYSQHTGQVTFAAGETSKTIDATVLGDTLAESDEQFFYNLSSPSGATIADGQGIVAIVDDDGGANIQVTVNDVTVAEGDSGTTAATLTISLTGPSENLIEVGYETEDGTAEFNDGDFNFHSGTLAFNPGVTSRTLDTDVVGDTVNENDEFLSLNLTNATGGATIADAQGRITILDDDDGPIAKEDSGLNLSLSIGRKIKASGDLVPAHPGDEVLVELYRKKGGRFRLVDTKTPAMGSAFTNTDGDQASPFVAKFKRPTSGKCRVKVSWPGDADTEAASARSTFGC